MFQKVTDFYHAAKTKVTTYFALFAATITALPQLAKDYWDQAVAAVPHLAVYHTYVAASALLVTIWLRVRRELNGTQAPPTPTPPVKVPAIALLLGLMMLAWASSPVYAATPNQAVLTWVPSTTRTDGTTITGPVTTNIYQGATGAEVLLQSVPAGTATITLTAGLANGTTVCWVATAVETATGLESARTNEVCKTFPQAPPSAPTGLTVK